jgi:small subunit ribosomal protein S6
MRVYEELFIVKPDAPEEEVDAYIGQLKELITNRQGTIEKADKWGVRKLAYKVSKYSEGAYVLIQFSSTPELVKEIERRMRVTDMVIKFITVRIDEKMKKIDKRKKHRDKRAARRPAPMAPPPAMPTAPAMPGAAAPGAPGAPGAPAPAMPAAPAPPGPVSATTEPQAAEPVTASPAAAPAGDKQE